MSCCIGFHVTSLFRDVTKMMSVFFKMENVNAEYFKVKNGFIQALAPKSVKEKRIQHEFEERIYKSFS